MGGNLSWTFGREEILRQISLRMPNVWKKKENRGRNGEKSQLEVKEISRNNRKKQDELKIKIKT